MTVFKTCVKILKSNWILLLIYFSIFTFLSLSMGGNAKEKSEKMFESSNIKLSIFNNDDSDYADSLVNYLSSNSNIVEIIDSKEGISDGLFYRITEYVLEIPSGFGESIKNGKEVELNKYEVADSYSSVYMDNMINNYIAKMKKNGPDIKAPIETKVTLEGEKNEEQSILPIYNFAAYGIMAIIILGVGTLMSTFSKPDLRRRNLVSPVSGFKINIAQILCSLGYSLVVWIMFVIVGLAVAGKQLIQGAGIYMAINMLVYSLVCLSLGFFISTLVKSENGRMIITNVISLGFSFIGGVMVPIRFLGDGVKIIGSFTPAYWYVNANETLITTTDFTIQNLMEPLKMIGIQGLFICALLTAGLAITRKKSTY